MTAPFPPGIGAPPWGVGQGNTPVITPPTSLGRGGVPQHAGVALQIPLPDVFPITDAREFNPLGSANTAAVQQNIEIADTVLDVPGATYGIIRGVSLYITDMLTTTDVTWSLIIDSGSPQGFQQLTIFPRAAPFVSNGFDAAIRFSGPARIVMTFTNNDGGTYVVGASYSGWYWPTASDARWRQYGN